MLDDFSYCIHQIEILHNEISELYYRDEYCWAKTSTCSSETAKEKWITGEKKISENLLCIHVLCHRHLCDKQYLQKIRSCSFCALLKANSPIDAVIEVAHSSVYRADRTRDSGKSRGGGVYSVCVYVNNS